MAEGESIVLTSTWFSRFGLVFLAAAVAAFGGIWFGLPLYRTLRG